MLVKDRIEDLSPQLTTAERRLSAALLLDYPFAGLENIRSLAERAGTSPPSISRFVSKLGFQGFQDFQRQLIDELKEGQRTPAEIRKTGKPLEGAFLRSFLGRVGHLTEEAGQVISESQFKRVCRLLGDPKRKIHLVGGRMSDTLMQCLSRHLQQARDGVRHMPSDPEFWPDRVLSMRPGDVLFMADFRRYQPSLLTLAERASTDRKARIVLLTDPWLSPVARHSDEVLAVPIETGTMWDSYSVALGTLEAIATFVADDQWGNVQKRIETWDDMRERLNDGIRNA